MTTVQEPNAPEAAAAPDIHTTAGKLADLRNRQAQAQAPSGEAAIDKVHAKGKLTARERITALLDEGSFVELDALARHRSVNFGLADNRPVGDGVVTGYGTIDGRDVCVFSQDATVFGGSLGEIYGEKIVKVMDLAIRTGRPLVGINEGAGARIQEGVVSLGLYGEIFHRNVQASGVIPQISLIMGPAAGGHVYSPALTDFVVMVDETSQMFVTGPDVIKTVTGEDVTMEDLGGARTHMVKSGVAHYVASGEQDAPRLRQGPAQLPAVQQPGSSSPRRDHRPHRRFDRRQPDREDIELDTLIPDSANQPYDIARGHPSHPRRRRVPRGPGRARDEHHRRFRSRRRTLGRHRRQPAHPVRGLLDIDASEKAARFVRTCDAFNVPIITLVDVPASSRNRAGIQRHHPPRREAPLRIRRSNGRQDHGHHPQGLRRSVRRHGLQAHGRRREPGMADRSDRRMGASGAVGFVYRKQLLEAAKNGEDVDALRLKLQNEYEDTLVNPYVAAERGYVDAVIPPSHTRGQIVSALRLLERKAVSLPPRSMGTFPMTATTEDILSEDVALAETAPTNGAVVEGTATDASLTELTETVDLRRVGHQDRQGFAHGRRDRGTGQRACCGCRQRSSSRVERSRGDLGRSDSGSTARVRRSRRTRT